MNKHEENKVTMFRAVLNLLQSNRKMLTDQVPVFDELIDEYDADVRNVNAKNEKHQTVAAGATDKKTAAEEALVDETVALCRPCYSYASRQQDPELQARLNVTESDLTRMRDTELLRTTRGLLELMESLQEELAKYNVTSDRLDNYGTLTETYGSSMDNRETLSGVQKAAREALTEAIHETDTLLKEQIDPLVENFRTIDREFYNQYQAVRAIKDL